MAIKASIKGDTLTLEIDLSTDEGLSKSEKNIVIASTRGNQSMMTEKHGQFSYGLNVYRMNPKYRD